MAVADGDAGEREEEDTYRDEHWGTDGIVEALHDTPETSIYMMPSINYPGIKINSIKF